MVYNKENDGVKLLTFPKINQYLQYIQPGKQTEKGSPNQYR